MTSNNIPRVTQQIFTGNAPVTSLAVFGTMKTGNPVYTNNVNTLTGSSAYGEGFQNAIQEDKAPYLEETNALFYGITSQLAYLFQKGIPEWDAGTTYYTTSFCQYDGKIYKSTIDNNINLQPDINTTQWEEFKTGNGGSSSTGNIGDPIITLNNNLALNEIWLEGQEVPRTAYPLLFQIYGTTYGVGDGATTFLLPDFRNRAIWGAENFGYIEAGAPNIKGITHAPDDARNVVSGAFYTIEGYGGQQGGGSTEWKIGFDASRSNPIYGASNTIQPPAIKVRVKTRFQ